VRPGALRHALGRGAVAPAAGGALAGAPSGTSDEEAGTRRVHYGRLARVRVRHTFYNASGGECRDFSVRPTASTSALMRTLGILFKAEADGFSVLYNAGQEEQLIRALAGRRTERGAWTRLSFLMSLRNPLFMNFTALPAASNPCIRNFYLTNRQAHRRGRRVLLAPGRQVASAQRVRVTGGQLAQVVTEGVLGVRVLALSGEEVLWEPRCRKVTVVEKGVPQTVDQCTDRVFLDFSSLSEGRYTLQEVYTDGTVKALGDWLYTSLYPMPLCFVDLLFSDPDGAGAGIYPVVLPPPGQTEGGAVVPGGVEYAMRFVRRSTWWNYFVVPEASRGELYDLNIEHVRVPESEPEVRFLGPCKVRLPGGGLAWRFLSECPLPLEQRTRLHLRLHGRTETMTFPGVLMDRMPVASAQQVLPMTPRAAYDQAWESLVRPDRPGMPCRLLLRRLRHPEACLRRRAEAGGPAPPPEYSDIYVHV
jgi:hypothetical protein